MKKLILLVAVSLFVFLKTTFAGSPLDFTFHKLESGIKGRTLLVIGGIQGDEPGGFNAASLLATRYKILQGNVWVVPNLNFISIIKRSRGIYGDLNRKFSVITSSDPEFNTIEKIKEIILDEQVDVVLNLHDGSGFYRSRYIDDMHNPKRWGQCVIIDEKQIAVKHFGSLYDIAKKVTSDVNRHLYSDEHAFGIMNTLTRMGNKEMSKTLTYYAICNLKPAFGVEASKTFLTHKRAYYHLRAIESFMDLLDIEYKRDFDLSKNGVNKAINNINLLFYNSKIFLNMVNLRKQLGYFPLKKGGEIEFTPSSPLITIVNAGKSYRIYHGNRRLARIYPEYFEYDASIDAITMKIDGNEKTVNFGNVVKVDKSFSVTPKNGYRVNIIGFTQPGIVNESGISVCKDDILKRFSIDKAGRMFRVEVYLEDKFSGMVLVNFTDKSENFYTTGSCKASCTDAQKISGAKSQI